MADGIFNLGLISIFFEAACLADHIDPGVHFPSRINRQEVTAGLCINAKHVRSRSFLYGPPNRVPPAHTHLMI